MGGYFDFHWTLKFTLAILQTLPPSLVPSYFARLLGERGGSVVNREEILRLTRALPPLVITGGSLRPAQFDHTLVAVFAAQNDLPETTPQLFYLALIGADQLVKETWATGERMRCLPFYYALRTILVDMDVEDRKHQVLLFFICLIRWEWEDRSYLALQMLDLGFFYHRAQAAVCWCLLAVQNEAWRKEVVRRLHIRWVPDLLERTKSAPIDLVTFIFLLRSIEFPTPPPPVFLTKPWYLTFREVFPTLPLTFLLALQVGARAVEVLGGGNYFTRKQWEYIYREAGRPHIPPEDVLLLLAECKPMKKRE